MRFWGYFWLLTINKGEKMQNLKKTIIVLVLLLCTIPVYSQQLGTGVTPPNPADKKGNSQPALTAPSYTDIPRSISLKMYCPKPESQGSLGTTCTWATTFYALSISENIAINRTDPQQITNNAFSPYYTYKNSSNDPTFQRGMHIIDALDFLKGKGAVRRKPEEKLIPWLNMPATVYANSQNYKILDYLTLFNYYNNNLTTEQKVLPVKRTLSEKKPVIIAFKIEPSFYTAKGVWQPVKNQNVAGYHAMCVIGYDDTISGGAFEIANSWGEEWGNDGFIWISYKDFADYVYEAYEIICNF
jgi:hypothetical protein